MMPIAPLIRDLAVILSVAAVVTLIFQRIRQPVVLGYLIAGLIVGPYVLPHPLVRDSHEIQVWAELGVIFLMFSLGLEFSFRKLARVGVAAVLTAAFEMSVMLWLGYLTGRWLGWTKTDAVFLGAMLSVSSTTIIIKALDELKLKTRRFAEMIFAVLIVEDLFAVLILVALSMYGGTHLASFRAAATRGLLGIDVLMAAGKLVLVVGSWFLAGYFAVPRFVRYVGKLGSDEMLSVLSVALCLALAVAAAYLHYSVALGAFIMGSILAESTESYRIAELIRPLRDLFAAIFFVSVGMLIDPKVIMHHYAMVLTIAVVLIVGKIVNITLGSLIMGRTLRTSIQVGFGMAQIGEFSFIIAALGQSLGVTGRLLYPAAVAVSVLTAFTTPYLIRISHRFAVAFERRLPLRAKQALTVYAAWALERKADGARRAQFFKRLFRWAASGLIMTVVFILVSEPGRQLGLKSPILGWAVAALLSAPFVWSMFFAFKPASKKNRSAGILFTSRFVTVLWLGILSLAFFTPLMAGLFTLVFLSVLFVAFHRQVGDSYRWFESRFLSTFQTQPKSRKKTDAFRHLAPWDAHLVRFKVHPNSEIAGLKLGETDLRGRFGLSIVVIHRGLKDIVAPEPAERIYPKDELLVLGTDDQLESARKIIERPPGLATRFHHVSGYDLKQVLVGRHSSFVGRSIRESAIREKYGLMVVGIERQGRRTINPSSETLLKDGDTVWVVGDVDKLEKLK